MKKWIAFFLTGFLLVSCGPDPQLRSDMLTWAKQIANLQKTLIANVDSSNTFLQQRSPTSSDCSQLTDFADRSKDLYNQIVKLSRPEEARLVHNEFVDSYSKSADADRFYAISVCQDDVTYYDKYASALVDANRTNEAAFHDFKQLMDKYSISCDDVGLCEDSVLPTPVMKTVFVLPTGTPDPCLRWDQVTAAMKGQRVCVRGVITNFIQTRKVGTRYEFTDKPNTFFIFSTSWEVTDPNTGKTLGPGTCIEATDVIQVQSGVPFVDIDQSISGKVFTDLKFYNDASTCQ